MCELKVESGVLGQSFNNERRGTRSITSLEQQNSLAEGDSKKKPRFLHVKVEAKPGSDRRHENVDIRIPIMLLKAGVKLGSIIPDKARGVFVSKLSDKGLDIDLKRLDSNSINTLIEALAESSIDIDEDHEKVRIFCA